MSTPALQEKMVTTLLERPIWPSTIDDKSAYMRRHDDTDGKDEGYLTVAFGPDGDGYIGVDGGKWIRFRTENGGGQSIRVRNALLVLAEAIRRDNEERPQSKR